MTIDRRKQQIQMHWFDSKKGRMTPVVRHCHTQCATQRSVDRDETIDGLLSLARHMVTGQQTGVADKWRRTGPYKAGG